MPSTLRKVLFFDRFRRVEGIFRFLKSRKKTFFVQKRGWISKTLYPFPKNAFSFFIQKTKQPQMGVVCMNNYMIFSLPMKIIIWFYTLIMKFSITLHPKQSNMEKETVSKIIREGQDFIPEIRLFERPIEFEDRWLEGLSLSRKKAIMCLSG